MSATTANNNKNQPAPARTSGRGAAVCITLGIFLLTLGCAWGLALIVGRDGYAMSQLCLMVQGLGGPLCAGLPFLCVWGGVKLLVSTRHRVSARDILIVSGLYWLILALYTLTAHVMSGGAYMDFVAKQVRQSTDFLPQYKGFLYQAYSQGVSGAGGLLGMLLAYPLHLFLTRIGAVLLLIILLAALVFALFRQNPTTLVHAISAFVEKRRQQAFVRRQNRAAEETNPEGTGPYGGPMDDPASPVPAEAPAPAFTQPAYYQPAPLYDTQPFEVPAPDTPDDDGFYPVQPGAFAETIPVHPPVRREAPAPIAWDDPDASFAEPPAMEPPSPRRRRRTPSVETVYEPAAPQPVPESRKERVAAPERRPAPGPASADPTAAAPNQAAQRREETSPSPAAGDAPSPSRKRSPVRHDAPAPAPLPTAQALDEEDDDLPWDVPSYLSPSASSSVKAPVVSAAPPASSVSVRQEPAAKKTPSAAPAPGDDWAAQVRSRQANLQEELPQHTTRKNEPQVVHTDPAVPITGERVPITPKRDRPDPTARMDGTSAPAVRQQPAGWLVPYQAPPIRLLNEAPKVSLEGIKQEDETRAEIIEKTLRSFGVESTVQRIMHGPSVTQFAIQIAPGIKVSRVTNTEKNLALELKADHVRVETPIKGTNYIGIEVPNHLVSTVSLREVLESPAMKNNPSPLLAALGKGISGEPVLCDLSKMPHLLIAGATGSGKSVCINSIVCSLLYRTSPEQVRMIMIDPKQVELNVYNPIPHLLVPVISDPKKAAGALAWVVQEMLERYAKFSALQVRNIAGYNKAKQEENPDEKLPNIVVVIDEMADLMEVCRKDVEESIRRLAALARAAGIYMVLATQRPSVDVITGVIKNNIPSRIAFAVSSGTDSRTIIDMNGAEKLMGKGDMLYKPTGATAIRVQGCFVSDEEVTAIAEHIGSRYQTDYDPNITEHLENTGKEPAADDAGDDYGYGGGGGGNEGEFKDLLQQAIEMAVEDGSTSTSMLQRRLRVGYARAGRLIDEMEKRGIISAYEGSKARKTLVTREQYAAMCQDAE